MLKLAAHGQFFNFITGQNTSIETEILESDLTVEFRIAVVSRAKAQGYGSLDGTTDAIRIDLRVYGHTIHKYFTGFVPRPVTIKGDHDVMPLAGF